MSLLKSLATTIAGIAGLAVFGAAGMSRDVANRYRRQQIRGTIEQMRIMLAANTVFAPALSIQASTVVPIGIVLFWTLGMILYSWALFVSWKRLYGTDGAAQDLRLFTIQTFLNAAWWVLGMALFYPNVTGEEKGLVTTIMAGSMALGTVGFSRAPVVGLTYLGVMTIGVTGVALGTAISHGGRFDYLVAALAFVAGMSLFNAVSERAKSSLLAFKNHEQLSAKTEVIELLLKDYEEQASEWMWQVDETGVLVSAPEQIVSLLGLPFDGGNRPVILDAIRKATRPSSKDDLNRMRKMMRAHQDFHDIRLEIASDDTTETRWVMIKGRAQFDIGQYRGYRGIIADVTQTVRAENRVNYLANFDSLTGLLNRNSVQRALTELDPEVDFAVVFAIDLDGFKKVNDSYGHETGDALLTAVGNRLRSLEGASLSVARLGGDEFLVILSGKEPKVTTELMWIADGIIEKISRTFKLGSFDIQVSASVGVAQFPQDTRDGLNLLNLSDLALYEAKDGGRNRVEVFTPQMQQKLTDRTIIIERLKRAVHLGEIAPHYQSQHDLKTGDLIGFEALARWFDEDLGCVGPDVFIPMAEQTGLIVPLGEHMLRRACEDAVRWNALAPNVAPVVSVNISPIQFSRSDIVALVTRTLEETGLPARQLEIEVTEGVLIYDKDRIAKSLSQLSGLGVSIALDDFGTGYSSLSYLQELPLNRLKIDRSFVSASALSGNDTVLNAIIQLGHSLGLNVIAEGVETHAQRAHLVNLACDDAQGYFFSKPMGVSEAEAMIAEAQTKRDVSKAG